MYGACKTKCTSSQLNFTVSVHLRGEAGIDRGQIRIEMEVLWHIIIRSPYVNKNSLLLYYTIYIQTNMYIIKSYFKCTFMWEVFLPFSSFSSFKNVMYQIRSGGIKPNKTHSA